MARANPILSFAERLLQREVAHLGADDALAEIARALAVVRDQVDQLVAVVELAGAVDHHEPVAVAVERDAEVGAGALHRLLQRLRRGGAETRVDVEAVGARADRFHVGPELVVDVRRDVVGGAVGAVDDDAHAAQVEMRRERALAELDIARGRVLDAPRLAELGGGHALQRPGELALDGALRGIGKLAPRPGKELDAVVVVGIVRSADHYAGGESQRPREIGDRRGRHGSDEQGVHAGGGQAGFESGLEHVAGNPRVLADQHGGVLYPFLLPAREHLARGVAQLHHEIRRDRGLPYLAANAVGAEVFSAHGNPRTGKAPDDCAILPNPAATRGRPD